MLCAAVARVTQMLSCSVLSRIEAGKKLVPLYDKEIANAMIGDLTTKSYWIERGEML